MVTQELKLVSNDLFIQEFTFSHLIHQNSSHLIQLQVIHDINRHKSKVEEATKDEVKEKANTSFIFFHLQTSFQGNWLKIQPSTQRLTLSKPKPMTKKSSRKSYMGQYARDSERKKTILRTVILVSTYHKYL